MTETRTVTEGTVIFSHPSLEKKCETWYQVIGDLSTSSSGSPLVTLHGGPGAGHNYLRSLSSLSTHYGIPVVLYDQLGCGKSTHLREKRLDEDFWTPELLMAELENLLNHLGIAENYMILGQSWGGMMGAMWAIKGHRGLQKLVISNSPASMPLWVESCNELRKDLPEDVEAELEKHEREKTYEDPQYEQAVEYFYKRHLCRIDPFPQDVVDTFENLKQDDTVYRTMNGPSEFTVVGNLRSWDITHEVHKINVDTLIISGQYDEAQAVCVKPFTQIPKSRWITMENASHMPNVEKPDQYMKLVAEFLKSSSF